MPRHGRRNMPFYGCQLRLKKRFSKDGWISQNERLKRCTTKVFNSTPLKNSNLEDDIPFWSGPIFRGELLYFGEGSSCYLFFWTMYHGVTKGQADTTKLLKNIPAAFAWLEKHTFLGRLKNPVNFPFRRSRHKEDQADAQTTARNFALTWKVFCHLWN